MNDATRWTIGIVIGFIVGFAIAITITHGSYNRGLDDGFHLGVLSVAEQRINRIR